MEKQDISATLKTNKCIIVKAFYGPEPILSDEADSSPWKLKLQSVFYFIFTVVD